MNQLKLWEKGVVYQIYPRSFQDSNNDGIGDIQGIISRLNYLKALGIDIIWLSPVYESPNDDNGYDISNYVGIHSDFGTMQDMDELINKAKALNIHIIMDLVINHTSDEHPWFIASKDPNSKYRDFYYWRDKPNNWTSFFSGTAWKKEGKQYYLHLFTEKQPDLNWHNPQVKAEIEKVMKFWLNKGIYGFRCDVINIIYKDNLENGKKRLVLTGLEHYHSQDGMHSLLNEFNREVFSQYDCFTVGETVLVTTKQANDLILPERQELNMVFGFQHMETDQINNKWFKTRFNPNKWMKVITKWQNEVYWNANYLENHDQPRSVSRFGDDGKYHLESAKMLSTINLSLRGTPYIYQGEEIGMTNGDFASMDEFRDTETHKVYDMAKKLHIPKKIRFKMMQKTSRDNARQPMQWNSTGGFTSGVPWLKMNKNTKTINVEQEENDKNSILNYYKKMIILRQKEPIFSTGDFESVWQKKGIYIFNRKTKETCITVVANMTGKTKKMPVSIAGEILISNYSEVDLKRLRPYEAFIVKH